MEPKLNLKKVLHELENDNPFAMNELFGYYYPRLYHFSRSILKTDESIDDILQEVFVRIWKNRENIRTEGTFNSYIFTITKNLLFNELRSRLTDRKAKEQIYSIAVADEYFLCEDIGFEELQDKIVLIIDELPSRQREIFNLSRTEGLSHKEIAEKLNISTKTVEYHITQAISYLKAKLEMLGLLSLLYFFLFL